MLTDWSIKKIFFWRWKNEHSIDCERRAIIYWLQNKLFIDNSLYIIECKNKQIIYCKINNLISS